MRLFIAAVLLLTAGATAAAPEAEPWERWTEHDETSEATIDHTAWDVFLEKYVVAGEALDLNRVRYDAVTEADHDALRTYIKRLENTDIGEYGRPEQRAFWTNLYNAVAVELVLRHYPVDSIRDIGGGFIRGLFGGDLWDRERVEVAGAALSLNDIEHRILRPIWEDGLTHYGVNCASVSCPDLLRQAYTGDNIDRLLRENARAYVNSPRGVRFDGGRLIVSAIYDWFQADFGGGEAGVISHLRRFAAPELSARLDAADGIDDYDYDWSLNDAR